MNDSDDIDIDPAVDGGLFLDPLAEEQAAIFKQNGEGETPYDGPRRRALRATSEEEVVIRSYLDDGLSAKEIADEYGFHPGMVNGVISGARLRRKAERIKNEIKEKIFGEKVPILEAIGDKGLIALYEWLDSFVGSRDHLKMTTLEANQLVAIVKELHTMFRLELGKSTQNFALQGAIEHTSKTMEQILVSLKTPSEQGGDPFINYAKVPQLDAPPEKLVIPTLEAVDVKRE